MMRKTRWIFLALACATTFGLMGCNPPAETSSSSGSTGKAPVTSVDVKDAGAIPTGGTQPESKTAGQEPKKSEPAATKEAVKETKQPETKVEANRQPTAKPAPAVAADTTEEMTEKAAAATPGEISAAPQATPAQKPAPAKAAEARTLPSNANRQATNANFVGTWTRFLDADTRKKYERMADLMKKQGRKVYPLDNTLVMRGDGTFRWEDNAVVVGQVLEGRWSLKNGEVTMTVSRIDGKAPTDKQIKEIKASVSRDGKMLWRNHEEKLRYNKK